MNVDSYYRATRGYAFEEQLLHSLGATLVLATARSEAEVIEACRGARIVLVEHTDTPFTERVIVSLEECEMIARYGIGVDNIDVEAATRHQVIVGHAPQYCVEEVSDHAAALILNAARRVTMADRLVHRNGWRADFHPPMRRLNTQILGLLGFGRIARRLAAKLGPFGFRIAAFDPYVSSDAMRAAGVDAMDFDSLLGAADFLSLHAPLTAETRHLIGADALHRMKPNSWIVNTSRGALIDEGALAEAISNGTIAGAALDVTELEPLPASSSLRKMDNVILTAHHAALSSESVEELRMTIGASVEAVLRGYWPRFVVNPKVRPKRRLESWDQFATLVDRFTAT